MRGIERLALGGHMTPEEFWVGRPDDVGLVAERHPDGTLRIVVGDKKTRRARRLTAEEAKLLVEFLTSGAP